jgi:hypothetical protein
MSFDKILEELPKLTREEKNSSASCWILNCRGQKKSKPSKKVLVLVKKGQASAGRNSIGKYEGNMA